MSQPAPVPASSPAVKGYVLAGGRSSRMGEDKAGLQLAGQSLLEIAVSKLRPLCDEVVLVGRGGSAPAGPRFIPDLHPGCGPLGGIEAALRDLHRPGNAYAPEWALFLPVDMPLLPAGLLRELLREWREHAGQGVRVAMVQADGRVQPLVSLLHRDLLQAVEQALDTANLKVRPVLEAAARQLGAPPSPTGFWITPVEVDGMQGGRGRWIPSAPEWRARSLWFGNLNTPVEFSAAASLADALTLG